MGRELVSVTALEPGECLMLSSILAVVKNGKIELTEEAPLAEGAKLLITFLPTPEEDNEFWLHASQPSLAAIWDNPQDDSYAQLLET